MAKIDSLLNKLPPYPEDSELLRTPSPPYYAVISNTVHSGEQQEEYDLMMQELLSIAQTIPGFLGLEKAYDTTENGRCYKLSVTYWDSLESIERWRQNHVHLKAKALAKKIWYDEYNVKICHVLEQYGTSWPK